MAKKKAVVVGARGTTGRNVVQALEQAGDWDIVGLSRQPAGYDTKAKFISVDIEDIKDAEQKLSKLTDATHIFYCGLAGGFEAENVDGNLALLKNAVTVIDKASSKLERVTLTEGGKYYGCHLGPFKTPSVETDPRHMPPNFYYNQQDFLSKLKKGKKWDMTVVRPEIVIGLSAGVPLNTLNFIAVYAAIARELDIPFDFPGRPAAWHALNKYTDAEILGRFEVWAATNPKCAGEEFNITNGDMFRWEYLWDHIGEALGCRRGTVRPCSLTTLMSDKGPVWDSIVKKYKLKPYKIDQLANWVFADWVFARDWDIILEDRKRIAFGYSEIIFTEQMFESYFKRMKTLKIIP
ncbi:MAG: SDR family oxidoreductase [Alphaproteobacteria bacterium]|nr:SDR family oxidoreductase [Alphaproteobacteria bacterium]